MDIERMLSPFRHCPKLGERGEAIETNPQGPLGQGEAGRQHAAGPACPSPPRLGVEDVEIWTWELELVGHISGEARVTTPPLLSCCLQGTQGEL